MSHIEKTIEDLENQINQKQREIEGLQIAVNNLYKLVDPEAPPRYEIKGQNAPLPTMKLRGDEYFRRPTATVITQILHDRKAKNIGPATIDELCEKMKEGGYIFDVKDPKISVGTALGKNPKFTRVGDGGRWGLTDWYPKDTQKDKETTSKRGRPKKSEKTEDGQDEPKN